MNDLNDTIEKYRNEMMKMISQNNINHNNEQTFSPSRTESAPADSAAASADASQTTRQDTSIGSPDAVSETAPERPSENVPATPPEISTPTAPEAMPAASPEVTPYTNPEIIPFNIPDTPPTPPEVLPPQVPPGSNIVMNSVGYLQVRTFTALDALPVSDALVVISRNGLDNRQLIKMERTNNSGSTQIIALDTVDKALSEAPGSRKPFATYDIEVTKPGFIPIISRDVPVFSSVTSVQNFEMIAQPEFEINPEQNVIQNNEPDL